MPRILLPLLIILLSTCVLFIGHSKIKGEIYAKKLIRARSENDYENAIQYAERSYSWFYQIDNFGMPLPWYIGSAYASMENYDDALLAFKHAYQITPFNVQVLNNLGSAFVATGNNTEAKSSYLEAIRIGPYFEDPKLNLAAVYFNEGNLEEARKWVLKTPGNSERKSYYLDLINSKMSNEMSNE